MGGRLLSGGVPQARLSLVPRGSTVPEDFEGFRAWVDGLLHVLNRFVHAVVVCWRDSWEGRGISA